MAYITKRRISPNRDYRQERKRHNEKWGKYYNDHRWRLLRNWFIREHPICCDCAINGISRAAEEVHHRIPFSWWTSQEDRLKALLCPDLLVSLCKECHLKRHQNLIKLDNFEETKEYKMIHNS